MTPQAGFPLVPREELDRLQDILNHNSDWIWEVDAQGRYTYCSGMVTQLLGRTPAEVIGKTPFDFMPQAEAERVGQAFGAIAAAAQPFAGLINRNVRPDGSIVVLETSGVPLFAPDGSLRGYRGIDRDISGLGERFLQLEAVYDTAPVALCTVDLAGRLLLLNRAMAALLHAQSPDALQGALLPEQLPAVWERMAQALRQLEREQPVEDHEFEWQAQWFYAVSSPLRDALGRVVGLSAAWTDITRRKRAEQQLTEANHRLEHYAQQDYLTGLYNRRYLDERLAREILRARREGQPLSLCMVDVDYFKSYNDRHGHLAGDECLRAVAGALAQAAARPGDIVSRYGGEEFVVVLCAADEAGAWSVAQRLRAAVAALRLPHSDSPYSQVTVSVGVVTCRPAHAETPGAVTLPGDARATAAGAGANMGPDTAAATATATATAAVTVQTLLRAVDAALYAAKRQGRNRVALQEPPSPPAHGSGGD